MRPSQNSVKLLKRLASGAPLRSAVVAYVIPLLLLGAIEMYGLWHVQDTLWGMYANQDGMWAAWNVRAIFEWSKFLNLSPYSILVGLGTTFLPNLPWLNPGALALGLPLPKDLNYLISYATYLVELFACTVLLLRVIGLSPLRSSLGAQIYVLILFPPSSSAFGALSWYSLAPVNAQLVSVADVILALFIVVGRYDRRRNLSCIGGMVALMLIGMYSAPITFLTYAPTYGLLGLCLLWGDHPRRQEILWKLGSVAAVAAVIWGMGFGDFLKATAEMSSRATTYPPAFAAGWKLLTAQYWYKLWRGFRVCSQPQYLLCNEYPMFWVQILALAGATAELAKRWGRLRPLALGFLLYVAFLYFYELVAPASLFGKLQVISVPYLFWASYPFFALFIVALLSVPFDSVRSWRNRSAATRASKAPTSSAMSLAGGAARNSVNLLLLAVVPATAWFLWVSMIAPYQAPPPARNEAFPLLGRSNIREPVPNTLTRYLAEHAAITPGSRFRGYTATYFGDPAGHLRREVGYKGTGRSVSIYIGSRTFLEEKFHNTFQEMDLWSLGIPTFDNYGQWTTRQSYEFARRLFSLPGDQIDTDFLRLYRLDIPLLETLGVRYLVTDTRMADPRMMLRVEVSAPGSGPMYLYELANPNLATYSPIRQIVARNFSQALTLVKEHQNAAKNEVVVFQSIPGQFVPARNAELRAERDGFRITADSDGASLLLIPVQFSRCLRVKPAAPGANITSASLHRGNAIESLLEFRGHVDARVTFDFGILGSASCRLRDIRELNALGLRG